MKRMRNDCGHRQFYDLFREVRRYFTAGSMTVEQEDIIPNDTPAIWGYLILSNRRHAC
ncbi:hypothetical protein KCP77_15035 [Salmonella enterica subsp. enterica]|nr:hypothetical protein KCP77_15035 [Salmonella enterica subsp. enterica]